MSPFTIRRKTPKRQVSVLASVVDLRILASCEAQDYFEALLTTVPWRNDEAVICGKRIVTARKVAWYCDSSFSYTYSGTTKIALPWTKELRTLKSRVEDELRKSD
jgi:alkylated DNA repair dioxygenase AlkB